MVDSEIKNIATDFDQVIARIRSRLSSYSGESKTGSQVHSIISKAEPDLDIRLVVDIPSGPGAFTKFAETYLKDDLVRVGHQGGDVLYSVGRVPKSGAFVSDPGIWKAFVSPNAVNQLYVRPGDGELLVVEHNANEDGVLNVEKITDAEHQRVRDEFLTDLQRGGIDDPEVMDTKAVSYEQFLKVLRSSGLAKRWGKYRREAFKTIFIDRLDTLRLSEEAMARSVGQLMSSQEQSIRPPEQLMDAPLSTRALANRPAAQSGKLDAARALAHSVIGHMTYDELRTISMPLGAVLDALSAQK